METLYSISIPPITKHHRLMGNRQEQLDSMGRIINFAEDSKSEKEGKLPDIIPKETVIYPRRWIKSVDEHWYETIDYEYKRFTLDEAKKALKLLKRHYIYNAEIDDYEAKVKFSIFKRPKLK